MSERRGRTRAIGAELGPILRPILGKRGLGEAQLVTEWEAVVGPELAAYARPDRLTFPHGERRDGTLRLRVAPAVAIELQHREPLIVERINAFFGYRAVARLAFIQAAAAPPPAPSAPRPRPLRAEEHERLAKRVETVDDAELRAALERLGAAIIGSRAE